MGWAGILGALGQGIGGAMMDKAKFDREAKLKKDLEDAQMKRQMFLEKYNSDLMYDRQQKLRDEENKAKETQFDQNIKATPGGVFGYNYKGESKKLRDLTPEEADDFSRDKKKEDQALRLNEANIGSLISSRQSADEDRKARREEREAKAKETPAEKEDRARRTRVADQISRLVANDDFQRSTGLDREDPEYVNKLAERASVVAHAADNAAFKDKQEQPAAPAAKPTKEQIMSEAQAAIARGAPKDKVEVRVQQLLQQYGY